MTRSRIVCLVAFIALAVATMSSFAAEQDDGVDVMVVGGGLMGSSAAWQLARAGQKVMLLEKQAWPYEEGSSLGNARIARSLGGVDDIWSYMHNRTVAETERLIAQLRQHGLAHSMSDIYTTSPVNYVRHSSHANRIESIEENQKDRYEYAKTPQQARELFDLSLPDDAILYREYKEHSGTIDPAALIERLHLGIRLLGGSVMYQQRVDELRRQDDSYLLNVTDTQSGERYAIVADNLVSAAGPYTGQLLNNLAPYFESLVQPRRVFLGFFALESGFYSGLTEREKALLSGLYPAINSTVPGRDSSFFTMLEGNTAEGVPIIKIGGHFQRSPISDLDDVWKLELSAEEIRWSRQSTLRHLALLGIEIQEENLEYLFGYSCVYSLTDTEEPYVTNIVDSEGERDRNLVVIAGLSGVGGKGAMAYGVMASNLLLDKHDDDPVYQKAVNAFGYGRLLRDLQDF